MARESMGSLFDEPEQPDDLEPAADAPLAERMRPRTFEEFVGQSNLIGEGTLLTRAVGRGGKLPSLILWGPPGTGKTTLGRLIARASGVKFLALSAVFAGVREVRAAIDEAVKIRRRGGRVDPLHRRDPPIQQGPAGRPLAGRRGGDRHSDRRDDREPVVRGQRRVALARRASSRSIRSTNGTWRRSSAGRSPTPTEGSPRCSPELADADLDHLARAAGRRRPRGPDGPGNGRPGRRAPVPTASGRSIATILIEALGRARFAYDKGGEEHYNLASALIKSLRNSDANAALYWLARLIEGGADPIFIARRLCILASEDVGLADPQAMVQAAAAAQIVQLIGLPEGLYPLTQATIYLARAPKSNAVKKAYFAAAEDAAATAREPVPLHLRNAVTRLMKSAGYGEGYRYVHDDPKAKDEMTCLPDSLAGKVYIEP